MKVAQYVQEQQKPRHIFRQKMCWGPEIFQTESSLQKPLQESWQSKNGRFGRHLPSLPSVNGDTAVEIKIPVRALAQELEEEMPLASAYKDLPRGRKRAGREKDFSRSVQKAAADLGNISGEEILKAVRESRSGRKKLPEITIVARSKKKTA